MSTHDDGRMRPTGQTDDNPAGIYEPLSTALTALQDASAEATFAALKVVEQLDPDYARWHDLYGKAGEPPNPPRELRLAYEQVKRLVDLKSAASREARELDERLYGGWPSD